MFRVAVLIVLSLMLAACVSLEPRYQRPAAPVADTWPSNAASGAPAEGALGAAELPWATFFRDEKLRAVIQNALDNNRTLRTTLADIESARALYRVQRADRLPTLTADVGGTKARSWVDSEAQSSELYTASVGLSAFEIDLFGKQRSLSRAALEAYLSTEEAARATRISLIAETANAYLTYAADNSLLAISNRTLESARSSMDLTQRRLKAGVASGVDVHEAETIYQTARSDVASLTATLAQDRNALELLTGGPVEDALLPGELPPEGSWLADVPAGVSSSVLLSRPDVLEAEHNLKAANANIGAARAAFFPSISLTASAGLASSSLSSLFSSGTNVWSVSPAVDLPLFTGGANTANLAYSKAQKSRYVAQYELAIQTAFKEVANALAVRSTIQEQLDAQRALVTAASAGYRLADARYRKGVDTYLISLDSQRTLYSAEQSLVRTRLSALTNSVTLYRALGGGLAL